MKHVSDILVHVKVTRGKIHDYLGMTLDYSDTGKLKIDMRDYILSMESEWPYEIKKEYKPWNGNLFKIDNNSKPLSEEVAKLCHRFIMKNMFLCKRGRSDVEIGVSFLSGRVREPTEQDSGKLSRTIKIWLQLQITSPH